MSNGRVLIYGGKGALGSAVLDHFKSKGFWTLNVDLVKNDAADANVVVDPTACWITQEAHVLKEVESALGDNRLDAVLCVAGGWAGGNAASPDFIKNADLMWKQSVWSSTISARIGSKFLKEGGLIQLTGAAAALDGTSGMIGYGLAKAAVHQLTKSLSDPQAAGKWMSKADFSTWTSLTFVADLLHKWTTDKGDRPPSGSLLKLTTLGSQTNIHKY
ncbi:hypothetical protein FO519_001035 [Halicephalobus sp. NKZ332]|nr:hypothetical protein FO519_001035 [Halicephalobus sp. NKZ332]